MATLSQCFHFFTRPAEGAVILRISCYFLGLTANEDMNWKIKKYHARYYYSQLRSTVFIPLKHMPDYLQSFYPP